MKGEIGDVFIEFAVTEKDRVSQLWLCLAIDSLFPRLEERTG